MTMAETHADISRIENVPLRVSVADIIRQAILNGTMKPGTPVVEMALAEQLQVSRAPVREAIQILEADGLIESEPYKGKRVKPLTLKEVEELYSLREQFEAFAIRRVVERQVDVSELRRHSDAMFEAAERGDLAALNTADEAFHRTLIRLADHQLMLSFWDNLYMRIRQIMALRNSANRDLRAVARNHPPIIEAIENRDMIRAISLISDHTRSASQITPEELGIAR
ncbi:MULTISPECIES: GntR family transcriptional regulator [unclassified Devosia]|uniref:GntR family transcriptional regulator n=1 Tax=unclassified Devosia TaxID=196773 RepID=UPI000714B55F|nr:MULTISPECIES: GntR family transcriptional regulator [unclassified Devosia]KQN72678.1 GntR family transcriptional regulator [Devosia sp. Leaf64]KQT51555.1 GntR family transcriptional regulator [Devosia sp. Leaf420]